MRLQGEKQVAAAELLLIYSTVLKSDHPVKFHWIAMLVTNVGDDTFDCVVEYQRPLLQLRVHLSCGTLWEEEMHMLLLVAFDCGVAKETAESLADFLAMAEGVGLMYFQNPF